jgi:carbamoylphosphate synthase large subunit
MAPDLLTHLRLDPVIKPYLIGVDTQINTQGCGYVDVFYSVPFGNDPSFVDEVAKIVSAENVNIVVPCSDDEAFNLSLEREKIEAVGAVVLASSNSVMNLIRNKKDTYHILKSAGVRVPESHCVKNSEELQFGLEDFNYPKRSVVVKPVSGRGGRGMRLLIGNDDVPPKWIGGGMREQRILTPPSTEEMKLWFCDGDLIVMPMLKAPVYDVDVLAVNGKTRVVLPRMRYNPSGIPFQGNRIVVDPCVIAYCREISEILGLDGLHDIDLMTDYMGFPCLLEVNPRPSGSVVASHAAGFPIVAVAIADKLGFSYPMQMPVFDIDVGMAPRAIRMRSAVL